MTRAKSGILLLDVEEDGRLWVITLNRPERLNALNTELRRALFETYWEFAHDGRAEVAILTGAGRAFCVGQDLRERAEREDAREQTGVDPAMPLPEHLQDIYPLAERLNCWKPMIAAVNGYAVAGGFNQALQCDLRIASTTAEFGISEARWNQGASWVHHLPRVIGIGSAMELVLRADRRISAERAMQWGLVNAIVEPDGLMSEARDWAKSVLQMSPTAIRNLKEIVYRGAYLSALDGARFGRTLERNLRGAHDTAEGARAYAEGRPPEFRGA